MTDQADSGRALTHRAVSLMQDHPTLVASASLVLLAVLHVWAVCGYDTNATLATLAVADRAQVLVATLVAVASTLGPFFAFRYRWITIPLGFKEGSKTIPSLENPYGILRYLLFSVTFILFVTVVPVLPTLAGFVIAGGLRWRTKRKDQGLTPEALNARQAWRYREWSEWTGIFLGVTVFIAVLPQPWVPTEDIRLRGERIYRTGYVLGQKNDFAVIRLKKHGNIYLVSESRLVDRKLCDHKSSLIAAPIDDILDNPQRICVDD